MATDNFNRADAANLGANWTATANNMQIVSNTARVLTDGVPNFVYYSGAAFNGDHSSQAVYTDDGEGTMSLTVRCQSNGDLYAFYIHSLSGNRRKAIYKYISGSFTQLGDDLDAAAATSGHTFRFEVQGTTLRAYDNGVQIGTDRTDSALSGGAPGIGGEQTGDNWDDWEGVDLGGSAISAKIIIQKA